MKSKAILKLLVYAAIPIVIIYVLFRLNTWLGLAGLIAYMMLASAINRRSLYMLKGKFEYGKGNLQQAAKWFGKATYHGNPGTEALVNYGFVLLKIGRFDEAERILVQSVKKSRTDDARNLAKSNLALVLWKKGKLDEAIDMLTKVVFEYKTTAVYGSLGYLLIEKGDLDKALDLNREAYEYNPDNAIILDNLAHLYDLRGENEKAAETFNKLMEKEPHFPEAYFDYGRYLEGQSKYQEAVDMYKKALTCPFNHNNTITSEQVREQCEIAEEKVRNEEVRNGKENATERNGESNG